MSDVPRILSRIEQGDPGAAGQLLPLVYEELRRLALQRRAEEAPDHPLQATALVHEAYLRLGRSKTLGSRGVAGSERCEGPVVSSRNPRRCGGFWSRRLLPTLWLNV